MRLVVTEACGKARCVFDNRSRLVVEGKHSGIWVGESLHIPYENHYNELK